MRTREAYHHQTPHLLTSRHIPSGQYAFLATLPEYSANLTALTEQWTEGGLRSLRTQDTFASKVMQFQLLSMRTPSARLPHEMGTFFAAATDFLPASELLVLDLAPQLSARYTFAKLLLNAQFAPAQLNADRLLAGSSLARSVLLGAHLFIAPALLVLAPYLYGVHSSRQHAATVWLFGTPVAGLTRPSNRIIDAVRPTEERFTGPRRSCSTAAPTVRGEQCKAFFTWWTSQVDKVLAVATDPVNFRGTDGLYTPSAHWQYLASIERLFRDVAEVFSFTEDNETARLRAAYDALDTLGGMGHSGFDTAVTPTYAAKSLNRLENALAPDIAALALPPCRRAVEALHQVKDGFLPTSAYHTPNGLAGLPGKPTPLSWDRATILYLRRDRNSAHSFLNLDDWEKALLFSHDGTLPRAVADLAFLYLLDLIADPDRLASKLRPRRR
ncbi:hypothetical protein [Kitasatospora indigofera]|uniref:hypothetical protein n=1 Tax=Kitasatospora indigofera TaxID=67307 RepID=UPI0036BA62FB